MSGTFRNSFKIFLASVLRWQGDQECTKQLQGEAQEGDVVCQTQDSSVAEQQHLQTELQDKNGVGRAGQAGGKCCKLDRQHVASIIDPDSERRRPSEVGIPEEPRQLELQAPLGHVTASNPRAAAVPEPALLQPAPSEFVVGSAAGSKKLLDLQHKVSSQMVSQASLSSVDLEAAKGQHTTIKQDVILRLEHLSPAEMKYTLWLLFVASLIGLVAVLAELSVKVTRDGSGAALNNLQQPVANMVFGITCWVLLTANLCQIFSRVCRAHRLKKVWKRRRLVTCSLSMLELIVQWVDATFFLIPNAYVLGNRCAYFSHVIVWGGFIRWSCWNTIFVVFLMHVHNAMPLSNQREAVSQDPPRNPHRSSMSSPVPADDTIVMDAPLAQWLRFHWPKYVLWAALEALLLVIAMRFQVAGFAERLRHVPESCDLSAYNCTQDSVQYALIIVAVCMLLLYTLLFIALVTRVTHLLKNKPYTDYKISHKVLRLQTRTRGMVMLSSVLCMVFLWWIFPSSCWGYMQTWLGFLPWQVTMTASCLIYSYIVMPIDPDAKAPILSAWLQELAWTEKEKPERLDTRNAALPDNEELRQAPMFCFETAMKMAYWSALVYDYKEAERTTLTLEDGSRLYSMHWHELYWERRHDTKCLMAWGDDAIVLAFRGTASFANARADLQAWRAPHPPARGNLWLGTKPLVHVGFLKSWVAGGLNQRVVGRVSELARAASAAGTTFRIYVTGHSLGGALATLAAFDIAGALQSADSASKHEVICYTFGAPRTGNDAFAQEFNHAVPDAWGIINDQDAVARTAKFVLLFKRPGQRVMINVQGDLIVRPSYAEANLQRTLAGHSVSDHLLSKYWQSLLTIVLNQFRCKRVRGGMRGVVRMAEESPALRQLFEEQLGMELGEMRRAARWANSHPSRVHLKNSHAPELAFYRKDRPSRDGRRSGSLGRSSSLDSGGALGCGGRPKTCRSGSLGHSNSLGCSSSSPDGFAKSGQDASAVAPN